MNGICLCIDRLHAGFVGACGSTWVQTPALDQLAADGFVFDQFLVDSLELPLLYRSYWFGRHALDSGTPEPSADQALPGLLRRQGVRTVLATDEPAVATLPGAETFDEKIILPRPSGTEPAPSLEATHLGQAFTQVIHKLGSLKKPFFVWCHLSSLGQVWDAPWDMRSEYAEADDPDPPDSVQVPCRPIHEGEDPDLLLGTVQAYAGQVSLLDLCLGALVDALADAQLEEETAIALVGLRGLTLGEHGSIGPVDDHLHGELVHVPLILRLPNPANSSGRSQALIQPPDLYNAWPPLLSQMPLNHYLSEPSLLSLIYEDSPPWRDRIGVRGLAGQRALRTPAWYLTRGAAVKLFAKPDDRWEVNDVADRQADIAEQLAAVLAEYETWLSGPHSGELPPLSDMLRSGIS
ncbi:MAG: sulfatase-like hydrolase/transferase [Thermoguttaceae bacterium]